MRIGNLSDKLPREFESSKFVTDPVFVEHAAAVAAAAAPDSLSSEFPFVRKFFR